MILDLRLKRPRRKDCADLSESASITPPNQIQLDITTETRRLVESHFRRSILIFHPGLQNTCLKSENPDVHGMLPRACKKHR